MADGNGSEWEARLRRVEQEHETFQRDIRNLLTAQVLQKDEIDSLLKASREQRQSLELEREQRKAVDEALDRRVSDVVSAIGELIRRIPPENLQWHDRNANSRQGNEA
jgi:predicted  nucleic acid-binding Zn-ribbon protein